MRRTSHRTRCGEEGNAGATNEQGVNREDQPSHASTRAYDIILCSSITSHAATHLSPTEMIWFDGSALVSAGRKNKKNLEEIKELWKSICKDRSSDGKPEQEQHQQPQTTGTTTTTTTTNNKNNNKSNSKNNKNNKNNNKSNSKNKNNNKSHNNKVGVGSCQVFGWGGGGGGWGGGSCLWLGVLFVRPTTKDLTLPPPPLP